MAGVDCNIDGVGKRLGAEPGPTPASERGRAGGGKGQDRLPNHMEVVIKALNDEHERGYLTLVSLLDFKEPENESPGAKTWNTYPRRRKIYRTLSPLLKAF